MKAILFIASRSRYHIPRVGGFQHTPEFAALTAPNQPIVFQGRALDEEEFNKAAAEYLDRKKPHLGYDVSVRMVGEGQTVVKKLAPAEKAPEILPDPPANIPALNEDPQFADDHLTPDDADPFARVGDEIHFQGECVAKMHDSGLRCVKGYGDRREEIETWLNAQPE